MKNSQRPFVILVRRQGKLYKRDRFLLVLRSDHTSLPGHPYLLTQKVRFLTLFLHEAEISSIAGIARIHEGSLNVRVVPFDELNFTFPETHFQP